MPRSSGTWSGGARRPTHRETFYPYGFDNRNLVELVCDIQRSIGSRANEAFTFGLFEGAISHFHRSLDAVLGVIEA